MEKIDLNSEQDHFHRWCDFLYYILFIHYFFENATYISLLLIFSRFLLNYHAMIDFSFIFSFFFYNAVWYRIPFSCWYKILRTHAIQHLLLWWRYLALLFSFVFYKKISLVSTILISFLLFRFIGKVLNLLETKVDMWLPFCLICERRCR